MHEAYQILRTEADIRRTLREKQRRQHGMVVEKEDEEKIEDETETENCNRDEFGIMESTSIPLNF